MLTAVQAQCSIDCACFCGKWKINFVPSWSCVRKLHFECRQLKGIWPTRPTSNLCPAS